MEQALINFALIFGIPATVLGLYILFEERLGLK